MKISRLTLPNYADAPALFLQLCDVSCISPLVLAKLREPVVAPRFGRLTEGAPVLMPEASMNEDDFPPRREYDIRFAGQVFPVEAVAVPPSMQKSADCHLGTGIVGPHGLHNPPALAGTSRIDHGSSLAILN